MTIPDELKAELEQYLPSPVVQHVLTTPLDYALGMAHAAGILCEALLLRRRANMNPDRIDVRTIALRIAAIAICAVQAIDAGEWDNEVQEGP